MGFSNVLAIVVLWLVVRLCRGAKYGILVEVFAIVLRGIGYCSLSYSNLRLHLLCKLMCDTALADRRTKKICLIIVQVLTTPQIVKWLIHVLSFHLKFRSLSV